MKQEQASKALFYLSIMLMVCLIYSKFILSVSIISILFLSILYQKKEFSFRLSYPYIMTTGIFLLVVLSVVNSSNMSDWFHHVKMKLPFLAVPLAFYNLPPMKERQYHLLHYVFFILMFSAAIPPLVNYGLHYYEFQEAIGRGKSISLPVQHVKFSLFYAFGIISLIILYRKGFVFKWRIEKNLQIGAIVLAILFLHILAIRTGILVFYVGLCLLAIADVVKKGKWKTIIAVLIMLFTIPIASYYTIPSFHSKVNYMLWDYGKYNQGEGEGYSDSERIESIKIGLQLVKEHPLSGTGIGDLKDETKTKYVQNFGPDKYVLYPHNQYLFVAAGMGLIGFLVFLFCLGFPYFYFRMDLHPLFLSLGIITFVAFFIDNLLERSVGVGFYVFFLCLGISLFHKPSKHNA